MANENIRTYIQSHILEPLKNYPTVIQDTMMEIITDRLEELYEYTWKFPEIINPNQNRIDILQTIANQFLFTIREDADLQEQIDILNNILYIYSRRGSIDTIENMWRYYGGELPKDVKVIIPSYNLFRYNLSALSGTHSFIKGKDTTDSSGRIDRTVNSPGVYEIRLTNNTYPIADLREFMIKELIAAGNEIYFTNAVHMNVSEGDLATNPYEYLVYEDNLINLQLEVLIDIQGITLSGYLQHTLSSSGDTSKWSGGGSIYVSKTVIEDIGLIPISTYLFYLDAGFNIVTERGMSDLRYNILVSRKNESLIEFLSYCTPMDSSLLISRYLYNSQGELITRSYPGYFVLGETLLGEEVV